jgi:4-hydroxy-tetrahydrodipicolinate reductase
MASPAHSAPLTRVAVIGVTGRMGQALLRSAPLFPQLIVTGAVASAASLALGRDAGEVAGIGATNLIVTSDLPRALNEADVALDFSDAAATRANLAACRAAHKPLLIGTTGHEAGLEAEFEAALTASAREIAVLVAPNTSIAVALLEKLVRASARALPASFDIDIVELHHRGKRDAPSGTALALQAAAAAGRPGGQIGIASLRAGDGAGEHSVLFSGPGEQLALRHRAGDRAIFARGALTAALWLASRPPGRYTMQDFIVDKTLP